LIYRHDQLQQITRFRELIFFIAAHHVFILQFVGFGLKFFPNSIKPIRGFIVGDLLEMNCFMFRYCSKPFSQYLTDCYMFLSCHLIGEGNIGVGTSGLVHSRSGSASKFRDFKCNYIDYPCPDTNRFTQRLNE